MDLMGLPADIFTCRTAEEVVAAIAQSGFCAVQPNEPFPESAWLVVIANKNEN